MKSFKTILLTAGVFASAMMSVAQPAANGQAVRDRENIPAITEEHKRRAADLVSRMTLEEKIDYIAGVRSFYLRGIERLGIPEIRMADGPQGVRNNTQSTMYPSGILTASTWNRDMAYDMGHGLGRDSKARGVSVIFGPGVNIYRAPMCGRNYEYFGEDPYLTGETAKNYILGVQNEGVIATIKHFAANNQMEYARHSVSSDVDERTLQEIYFPAFRKAVQEAGVGAVMNSYNLINGVHATENPWMNIDVLRNQWGFEGILMSDWTSVYSTVLAANAGLDLEMPKGVWFTREKLLPAIANGTVSEKTIDEKVQHLLQTFIAFGLLDRPHQDTSIALDNEESRAAALEIAREGVVLLKNENLPLDKKSKVLVLGPNAGSVPTGGGSGFVHPFSTVSVAEGMTAVHGEKRTTVLPEDVLYENIIGSVYTDDSFSRKGFNARYYNSVVPEGEVFKSLVETELTHYWKYGSPFEGMPDDKFSVTWTGVYKAPSDGLVRIQMGGDDGYRFFVNGEKIGGDWGNHSLSYRTVFFNVEKGKDYNLKFEFFDNAGEGTVVFKAGLMNRGLLESRLEEADNVVYCAGFDSSIEGEGWDRNFQLPKDQTDMIDLLTSLHDNVTVVINAGGGVDFSGWSDNVESVLMAWYPGQEGGTAVAEVLSGRVNPSGRLPISIESRWEDSPVHDSYYDVRKRVTYSEGIFTGYRGYDRNGVKPMYPFGYGLSYTTFGYSDLRLEKLSDESVKVVFNLTNTGRKDGAEVAQVYVRDIESSVVRPLKELKGYEKVWLKAGETVTVEVVLDAEAFAFYDIHSKKFVIEPGDFEILVGGSSADLPLKAVCRL